jgi:hypothetical protein
VKSRGIALAVGTIALAFAAGCSGGSSGGDSGSPPITITTPPIDTPTPTVEPSSTTPTATPTATSTTTTPAAPAACRSGKLKLSVGSGQGAAGTTYQSIVLTNVGAKACTLFGYPGVSFVDAAGTQLGKPAGHDNGQKKTISLAPGGAAYSTLRQPNAGNFDAASCQPTTADRLRVYPPGETVALYVHDAAQVCAAKTNIGRTGVTPVVAGAGG